MNVADFLAKLKIEIAALESPVSSARIDADYMAELQKRTTQFRTEADRVLMEIVGPRLRALGSLFANATEARRSEPDHRTWWYGYSERFPASAKLDVSVSHDECVETLILNYEVRITPAFVKYDRFDRISIPLAAHDATKLADWVENRLVGFLHTYMSLGTSDRDQSEGLATDPVCGMRVSKQRAAAQHDYAGHRYYFCSLACREEFAVKPTQYVTIVTS